MPHQLIVYWRPHNEHQVRIWRSDWPLGQCRIISNDRWAEMQKALELLSIPIKDADESE